MKNIKLDGTTYDVKVVYPSLKRSFDIVQGTNQGVNIQGGEISDVLGTKYTYSVDIEPNPSNPTAYDTFYQAITNPVDYHYVELPYGQTTMRFNCKIVSGTDTNRGKIGGYERWTGLTISFIPITPQRARA